MYHGGVADSGGTVMEAKGVEVREQHPVSLTHRETAGAPATSQHSVPCSQAAVKWVEGLLHLADQTCQGSELNSNNRIRIKIDR